MGKGLEDNGSEGLPEEYVLVEFATDACDGACDNQCSAAPADFQWLFVARTEILNTKGEPEQISYMKVGYSPLAILLALLFRSGMVIAMMLDGSRRLRPCVLVGITVWQLQQRVKPKGDKGAALGAVV